MYTSSSSVFRPTLTRKTLVDMMLRSLTEAFV
jgi:hypothetical protein